MEKEEFPPLGAAKTTPSKLQRTQSRHARKEYVRSTKIIKSAFLSGGSSSALTTPLTSPTRGEVVSPALSKDLSATGSSTVAKLSFEDGSDMLASIVTSPKSLISVEESPRALTSSRKEEADGFDSAWPVVDEGHIPGTNVAPSQETPPATACHLPADESSFAPEINGAGAVHEKKTDLDAHAAMRQGGWLHNGISSLVPEKTVASSEAAMHDGETSEAKTNECDGNGDTATHPLALANEENETLNNADRAGVEPQEVRHEGTRPSNIPEGDKIQSLNPPGEGDDAKQGDLVPEYHISSPVAVEPMQQVEEQRAHAYAVVHGLAPPSVLGGDDHAHGPTDLRAATTSTSEHTSAPTECAILTHGVEQPSSQKDNIASAADQNQEGRLVATESASPATGPASNPKHQADTTHSEREPDSHVQHVPVDATPCPSLASATIADPELSSAPLKQTRRTKNSEPASKAGTQDEVQSEAVNQKGRYALAMLETRSRNVSIETSDANIPSTVWARAEVQPPSVTLKQLPITAQAPVAVEGVPPIHQEEQHNFRALMRSRLASSSQETVPEQPTKPRSKGRWQPGQGENGSDVGISSQSERSKISSDVVISSQSEQSKVSSDVVISSQGERNSIGAASAVSSTDETRGTAAKDPTELQPEPPSSRVATSSYADQNNNNIRLGSPPITPAKESSQRSDDNTEPIQVPFTGAPAVGLDSSTISRPDAGLPIPQAAQRRSNHHSQSVLSPGRTTATMLEDNVSDVTETKESDWLYYAAGASALVALAGLGAYYLLRARTK